MAKLSQRAENRKGIVVGQFGFLSGSHGRHLKSAAETGFDTGYKTGLSEALVNKKLVNALKKIVKSTCENEDDVHTYNLGVANKALYEFGQIARKAIKAVEGSKNKRKRNKNG